MGELNFYMIQAGAAKFMMPLLSVFIPESWYGICYYSVILTNNFGDFKGNISSTNSNSIEGTAS